MKDRILALRSTLRARIRVHAEWIWIGAAAVVVVSSGLVVGATAHRRAAALRADVAELRAIERGAARWVAEFQPATPAESLAWLESRSAVREAGVPAAYRTALAAAVARRAEETGIADPLVRLVGTDTISHAPLSGGAWTLELSPVALEVEAMADLPGTVELLKALPPQVDVRSVSLAASEAGLRSRILLILFHASQTGDDGPAG